MTTALILLITTVISALLFYASYSIASGVYLKALCRISTQEKKIVLSFDDGPSAHTGEVLDLLKEHETPALFFLIGEKAESASDMVKRIKAEGHLIGNHSYSHQSRLPLWPWQKIRADIVHCSQVLEKITEEPIRYYRPPFGVTNPLIKKALAGMPLQIVGWNIRSYDTMGGNPQKVLKRITRQLKPGSIILLHDRMPNAPQLLKGLLNYLETNGWQIERLDHLINKV